MGFLSFRNKKTIVEELEEMEEILRNQKFVLSSRVRSLKRHLKREVEKYGEIRSSGVAVEYNDAKNSLMKLEEVYALVRAKRQAAERQEELMEQGTIDPKKLKDALSKLRKLNKTENKNLDRLFTVVLDDLQRSEARIVDDSDRLNEIREVTSESSEKVKKEIEEELLKELGIDKNKKTGFGASSNKDDDDEFNFP